jgi:ParB-like chromosome segregation protein Spo0J
VTRRRFDFNKRPRRNPASSTLSEPTVASDHPWAHAPRQIKQIARSISIFGFLIPIIVDEADRVRAGVGCLLAAGRLDCNEVPTIHWRRFSGGPQICAWN